MVNSKYEFKYKNLGLLKNLNIGSVFVLEGRNIPYKILKKEGDIVFFRRQHPNPNPNVKTGKSYQKYLRFRETYKKNGNVDVYDIVKIK